MTTPVEGVRRALQEHVERLPGVPLLIACSGGPDSLALVHLAVRMRESAAVAPVHVCVVDHQLQPHSAEIAKQAAADAEVLGADAVHIKAVTVVPDGRGLEAAARMARRRALEDCAGDVAAAEIWLGHTRDDQAETVLLGLARGSGARSLAGMRQRDGIWVRPLLHSRREDVHNCLPENLPGWQDPHNQDPRFLRARVRHELLPLLESILGERAVMGLARTADLLRDDDDALTTVAAQASLALCVAHDPGAIEFSRSGLSELPAAIRHRVIREVLIDLGCPPVDLTSAHYQRIDAALVSSGTVGPLAMPNGVSVTVFGDRLAVMSRTADS